MARATEEQLNNAKRLVKVYLVCFLISGAIVIIAASCAIENFSTFQYFVLIKVFAIPLIFLATGLAVFVVALVGWRGLVDTDYDKIMAFILSLVVVLVIEMAIGIVGAILHTQFPPALRQSMNTTIDTLTLKDERGWDTIHRTFECCGLESPKNWVDANKGRGQDLDRLPNSCCNEISGDNQCRDGVKKGVNSPWRQGCWDFVEEKMHNITAILAGTGITMSLVTLIGICVAGRLALMLKKDDDDDDNDDT